MAGSTIAASFRICAMSCNVAVLLAFEALLSVYMLRCTLYNSVTLLLWQGPHLELRLLDLRFYILPLMRIPSSMGPSWKAIQFIEFLSLELKQCFWRVFFPS